MFEKPPIEILCKYYIRAYEMQSKLFSSLNKDLRQNKITKYLSFIKILYAGIKLKSISLANIKNYIEELEYQVRN